MATLKKTYQYKVYTGSTYMGMLANVVSDFTFNQPLNSAGAQLTIQLGDAFPDIGAALDASYLIDESGNRIIDETGGKIILSATQTFANLPINLANRIVVTMTNDNYPTGKTVFDGFIDAWEADYLANKTTLTVLSHGSRLDHYIIDPSTDINIDQSTYNTELGLNPFDKGTPADIFAQTFTIATDVQISTITVAMRRSGASISPVTLTLIEGTPAASGATLGSVALSDLPSTSVTFVDFNFGVPVGITGGATYFWQITNQGAPTSGYSTPYVEYQNTDLYAGGSIYENIAGGGWVNFATYDAAFQVTTSTGSVGGTFTLFDPANIVRAVLDIFQTKGGIVTYTSSSIDNTGVSASYEFVLGTILEGIKKGYSLVPSNWYWYGDPATNLIEMHATSGTPTHYLVLGKHINNLVIKQSLDSMKNIVYFSGGDVGTGDNLFRVNSETGSIALYGQWLLRISDNRVSDGTEADLIALGEISRYSSPIFTTTVTIPEDVYDIETYRLGQVVGFRNFNNLIDSVQMQIVGRQPAADSVTLTLGSVLPRNSSTLDDLSRRLTAQETINNPPTPN